MEFSKKLKKLRLERGLSQQRLADMIFVSRSAVAKWENGLGLPSEESYEALSTVFGVSKECFMTEEPEQIIINKNRKVKKLSGSMCAVAVLFAIMLIVYGLFHPVPYHVTATCHEIEVQIWDGESIHFSITDEDTIEGLVDSINATTFRKSLRISQFENYPHTMRAVLMMRTANNTGCTVVFCSTPADASVYILPASNGELIAINSDALSDYIVKLLEDETAGAWTFS